MMIKMIKKEELTAKIYYHAYLHPGNFNIYQMDKKIFGKHTNRVQRAVKNQKLVERGFLKIKHIKSDGREQNIIYAQLDPIISIIEKKSPLTNLEKHILKKLIGSNFFRHLIGSLDIDVSFGMTSLFYIILMNLDYWSTFYLKNSTLTIFGTFTENNIDTIEEYDQFINKIKNIFNESEFNHLLRYLQGYDPLLPIIKLLENQKKNHKLYLIVKESLFLFFIPKNLMEKIRGISLIGRMDIIFSSLYSEVKNEDTFTNYILSKIKNL